MSEEPVLTAATIAGAISAILVALVSLGVIDLTPDQQAAILAAVVAVLPIAMALWARMQVTPLADPKIVNEEGEEVSLIRADTGRATPQAIAKGNVV